MIDPCVALSRVAESASLLDTILVLPTAVPGDGLDTRRQSLAP
jgi:hypothetical protein